MVWALFAFAACPQAGAQEKEAPETAGATVAVNRPAAGETIKFVAQAGALYDVSFDATEAKVLILGSDFVLSFSDEGRIVFLNLVDLVDMGEPSSFRIGGEIIDSAILVSEALYTTMGFPDREEVGDFSFAPFPELRRARLGE